MRRTVLIAVFGLALAVPAASAAKGPGPVPPECNAQFQFPPQGFYPVNGCLVQGNGGLSISPKVVRPGQTLTATISPPPSDKGPTWDWGGFAGAIGIRVSGCRPQNTTKPGTVTQPGDASCTVRARASAASSKWETYMHAVTESFEGCCPGTSVSSDYFIISPNLFELSGTVTDENKKPLANVVVDASGPGGSHSDRTDASGDYRFPLPRGTYRVTVPGKATKPPAHVVNLRHDTKHVDFSLGGAETVSVSFDPPAVRADGFGFARLIVKVTDAAGNPVAGRHVLVEPKDVSGGTDGSGPASPAVLCSFDGSRQDPSIFIGPQDFNSGLHMQQRVSDFNKGFDTDASGTIELLVFAGTEDWSVTVFDALAKPNKTDATLRVGPRQARGGAPTPNQLRSDISGSVDFVNASPAQIQAALGEYFLRRSASGLGPDVFFPLVGNGHAAIGFGAADDKFSSPPGYDVDRTSNTSIVGTPGVEGDRILDAQLATFISQPFTINGLPSQLPTVDDWAKANPAFAGFSQGQVWPGHEQQLDSDYITYFYAFASLEPPRIFQWPYPPADMRLRLIFERCVPELGPPPGVFAQVFSPLQLEFVDLHGNQFGIDARGKRQLKIPGGLMLGGHPQLFMVPPGSYAVRFKATGSGTATVAFYSPGHGSVAATRVFTLNVHRGQSGTLRVNGSVPGKTIRVGGHVFHAANGLAIQVRGLPKRLRIGKRRASTVRVVDQTGRPVIAATLTIAAGKAHITIATGSNGTARVNLQGRRGGLRLTVTALGYVATRLHIAGFK